MTAYKPSGRLSIRHVMLTLHNLLEEDQTNQSQKETMEITDRNIAGLTSPIYGDKDNYVYVAAIDFGTTHSGYAFSPKSAPSDIYLNKDWGSEFDPLSYKCPTTILTNSEGNCVSFGFVAENDFCVETEGATANGFDLFRHFKMMLHKDKINQESTVVSTTGNRKSAIEVFAMAMEYLKNHFLQTLRKRGVRTLEDWMIKWVITVPAIWRDVSKRFMREAAFKAGMIQDKESEKLIIALEPEAASMFCRNLQKGLGPFRNHNYFRVGQRYMVVDAGGGTVGIAVHEVVEESEVKELFCATGGPWGAITVDQNFEALLSQIFGDQMMQSVKSCHPQEWMRLMFNFEKTKQAVSNNTNINIDLPYSMHKLFQQTYPNKNFCNFVKIRTNEEVIAKTDGVLIIKKTKAKSLFDFGVNKTVEQMKDVLQKVHGVGTILLVGGFGQCDMLKEAVKNVFKDKNIVTPFEAQLAVLKGAVLFGHDPSIKSVCVARVTYGIGVMKPFHKSKHDLKHITYDYGRKKSYNLFDTTVKKHQEVATGKVFKYNLLASEQCQKAGCVSLILYHTSKGDVTYIDETGVHKLISVKVPLKSGNSKSQVEVHIEFGPTELTFKAQDKESKEWVQTKVDFFD